LGFDSSSKETQAPSRYIKSLVFQRFEIQNNQTSLVAPSSMFCPLQRIPAQSSSFIIKPASLTPNVYRFSQPLDASNRSEPAGLISYRIRSWGSLFRAFSSRTAVRCFQRRYPLNVKSLKNTYDKSYVLQAIPAFRVLLYAKVRYLTYSGLN
jgi:hypothetical protein